MLGVQLLHPRGSTQGDDRGGEGSHGTRRLQGRGDLAFLPKEGGWSVKDSPSRLGTPSLPSEGRERDVLEASLHSGAEISQDGKFDLPHFPLHFQCLAPGNAALWGEGWLDVEFSLY